MGTEIMNNLKELAKLIRSHILISTTEAGSGHPSSSLSATDIMAVLFFGRRSPGALAEGEAFFYADLENPANPNNDRLIFSKGHASPLFYSLYAVAGQSSFAEATADESAQGHKSELIRAFNPEELLSLRKFGSRFEGHPTLEFPYTEVPTGSLGQGLSVGVGMALNAKAEKLSYNTFVLLGDSEVAEGSIWEAMDSAAHYKLNNLIAILDCNRLGQRGETMFGHRTEVYEAKAKAFGWETVVIDGHDMEEVEQALYWATTINFKSQIANNKQIQNPKFQNPSAEKPRMIIAKTLKGKGVSFIEDKDGWHGKALSKDELAKALVEIGAVDKTLIGEVLKPETPTTPSASQTPLLEKEGNVSSAAKASYFAEATKDKLEDKPQEHQQARGASHPDKGEYPAERGEGVGVLNFTDYSTDKKVATRKAFGNALINIAEMFPNMVVLDAEVSNSTFTEFFKKKYPERFYEMYIAEQNMVGVATGLDKRGKLVFASTFAAFYARAFDQVRMSQYAMSNIKFVQSHAGVSIGEDGASQMALEDLAMFRTIQGISILYPSDAVSAEKITYEAAKHKGSVYIRNTRMEATIIYSPKEEFPIGGSKTLKTSDTDVATVIGAGVTLHEALKAYKELQKENINIRVIDLYSIKPLDIETLKKAAAETKNIIVVEDHYLEGGIYEAVASALFNPSPLLRALPTAIEENTQHPNRLRSLAVKKMPRSGKPEELLAYEEIDKDAIVRAVKLVVS
jgi:transketolase